jgi:hypothetical protein
LKESNTRTLNTFKQDVYAKLIILTLSKIFSSITTDHCPKKLRVNEHINFQTCMGITTNSILKPLFYGLDNDENLIELVRLTQIIRKNTVISKKDRHFPRIAVRTDKKWYSSKWMYSHQGKP